MKVTKVLKATIMGCAGFVKGCKSYKQAESERMNNVVMDAVDVLEPTSYTQLEQIISLAKKGKTAEQIIKKMKK